MDDRGRDERTASGRAAPPVSAPTTAIPALSGLLHGLPIALYTSDRNGRIVECNRRAAELCRRNPDVQDLFSFNQAGSIDLDDAPMAQVLQTGEPIRDRELVLERPDGTRLTVLASLDPIFGDDGEVIGVVSCLQDITELKRRQEIERERVRWFHELLQALPAPIYTTDAAGHITFYNDAAAELAGRKPTLGKDQWCVSWRLYRTDGSPLPHDQCPMATALKENRSVRGVEAVIERPDGTRVPFVPYPTPLRDASGALVGAVNMLVDVTQPKQAEAQRTRLLDELNHRVKNTLATVQALAAHSIRGNDAAKEMRDIFEARLFALSRTHDQLMHGRWESADLKLILDEIIAPHLGEGEDRIHMLGDPIKLGPRTALTLAMVLHELAANAAKHGALSASAGKLAVSWDVTGSAPHRWLAIDWRESGGPAVRPPDHRGFGSRLLERSITHELKGAAEVFFEPTGIHCTLGIPLGVGSG